MENLKLNYDNAFEYYCIKNCYLQILRYYGVKQPEFYIETIIDWKWFKDSQAPYGYRLTTGTPLSGFLFPYDNKLLLGDSSFQSAEEIWMENEASIKNGIPVVVAVDVFFLPYTPYFQKKHAFHSLIITGICPNGNVEIIDYYPPWFYRGEIERSLIEHARNSDNSQGGLLGGIPINYMWSTITVNGWNAESKDLVTATVNQSLNKYFLGSNNIEWCSGCYVLEKLLALIMSSAREPLKARGKFLEDLYQKLYFVVTRKRLHLWYISLCEKVIPSPLWSNCSEILERSIRCFKTALNLCIKFSIRPSETLYDSIITQFIQCKNCENQFFYNVFQIKSIILDRENKN